MKIKKIKRRKEKEESFCITVPYNNEIILFNNVVIGNCQYGVTKYGISNTFNISEKDAENYLQAFAEAYPEVIEYQKEYHDHAKKYGYVKSLLGRKRRLPQLTYIGEDSFKNSFQSSFNVGNLLNNAINMPVQSTSGQTTIIAMTNIWKQFKKRKMGSRLIINVHDELVSQIPIDEIQKSEYIINTYMTKPYYKNRKGNTLELTAGLDVGEIWKYGYSLKYWEDRGDEWNAMIENINKRNVLNESFKTAEGL